MVKIKQPIKEFWESDKKPAYLQRSKRTIKKSAGDNFTHNIRIKGLKSKKK